MRARSVLILSLLIVFLTIAAQNVEVVSVKLLFWNLTMSRALLIGLTLGIGVIIGVLLGRPWRKRKQESITIHSPISQKIEINMP